MANHWFQFKQFKIEQDKCGMKVTTDACLFGAWVASDLAKQKTQPQHILDIGAGTGLLSLMLAQKVDATIHAVEIDAAAAEQAKENCNASNWSERLTVTHLPLQELESNKLFDVIISNPPFFDNDLKSIATNRNLALHSTALDFQTLLSKVGQLLKADGSFFVLIPAHRTASFIVDAAKSGFHVSANIAVQQTEKHPTFRNMLKLVLTPVATSHHNIIIKENQDYTEAFTALLSDYYLFL